MSVLKEILEWSQDRPTWQRDALRRIVLTDKLTEADISELSEICKSAHGLSELQDSRPLAESHIPDDNRSSSQVVLNSILHNRGVNALAEEQTLKFDPRLTVVYGDNAAGKTGYIRILKNVCRARGQEEILGNVVSSSSPNNPRVKIKYQVGDNSHVLELGDEGEDDLISRISVFDTQSASVYLTEKTDVAFQPFGLDLFDKLVKVCKAVRSNLEKEQRALTVSDMSSLQATVPEGTAVAKFLGEITYLTTPESVQSLAYLSLEKESRLLMLEKSLQDLQANDLNKLIPRMELRVRRISKLAQHLKEVEDNLSEDSVNAAFTIRNEGRLKSKEAKRLRETSFPKNMLEGTGSGLWAMLWESARKFSEELAYPRQNFPVVGNGARCLLCQQDIDHIVKQRLERFKLFVISTAENELREIRDKFIEMRKKFTDLQTLTQETDELIEEIRIEQESLAETITTALTENERRRKTVVETLSNAAEFSDVYPKLVCVSRKIEVFAQQFDERIKNLRNHTKKEVEKQITEDVQELRARKLLSHCKQIVLSEIERKKKIYAYGLCLNDTKTQAITQKSTTVTKTSVTKKLKQSFKNELVKLEFRHVEVELKEVGGTEGVLYHKLILTSSPSVGLPRVVSEGEQRCLSIAAFFAELSTTEDFSGIVLDDPISSLDYKWRELVAKRLVIEAKTRQVIVFTHDVSFLLLLKKFSEELGVEQLDQWVRQLPSGAGVCEEKLPWVALPVNKRIGFILNLWQKAEKLFRDGNQSDYEKKAAYIYGLLREAWERALEEVLLSGVVERFRSNIQTQQVKKIADITEEDCNVLYFAMNKCSKWLPGHDQAAADRADIPEPDALNTDITELKNWVSAIRKRRN